MNIHNSQSTIQNSLFSNPATFSAHLLVSALAAAGLRDVVIAPGSRSTPLTLAFAAEPGIVVHLQLDERSAGFLALGLALGSGRPTAVVCTSGTAAANFFPAVIEAHMSHVPLIVLTADRPPELRHSGANQTIDQVKMYGDHVLWSADLGVPTTADPETAWRNVATTAARAYAVANGLRRGPVHLNVPFRKPLEPEKRLAVSHQPSAISRVEIGRGSVMPTREQIETLTGWLDRYEQGVIVCGPGCPAEPEFATAVAALARRSGYPIAADPLSGLRFGPWTADAPIMARYETVLAGGREPQWPAPQIVIRFGQVPTGKWLNSYLERHAPAVRLHVRESGVWADDAQQTTDFWQTNETALCQFTSSLMARDVRATADPAEAAFWEKFDAQTAEENADFRIVADLFEQLPAGANVMVGNSLPIRHADQFARPRRDRLHLFGNRGASGIDGVVSTAVGIARARPDVPAILLIGDVSFFHDQNGLLAARETPNLKIVLLHNDGGGIFRRLPVANEKFEPSFTELFITPHGLDFEPVCRMFGLRFENTMNRPTFATALAAALAHDGPAVVQYRSDSVQDENHRRDLVQRLQTAA